jgi:hypothetical protein
MRSSKHRIFTEKFKGHDIIAVWEVDPCGNKVGKYPVISFGTKKAEVIIEHIESIKFELLRLAGPKQR